MPSMSELRIHISRIFGSDLNEVSIIYKEDNKNNEVISKRKKSEIAKIITEKVISNFNS